MMQSPYSMNPYQLPSTALPFYNPLTQSLWSTIGNLSAYGLQQAAQHLGPYAFGPGAQAYAVPMIAAVPNVAPGALYGNPMAAIPMAIPVSPVASAYLPAAFAPTAAAVPPLSMLTAVPQGFWPIAGVSPYAAPFGAGMPFAAPLPFAAPIPFAGAPVSYSASPMGATVSGVPWGAV